MRIAIIIRRLDAKGGTQRQALSLARELASRGHAVSLYTFRMDRERCYPELIKGLAVVSLSERSPDTVGGFLGALAGRSGFFAEIAAAKRLALLIDPATDVLNPHDTVAYRASFFFKKHVKNIPSVWQMNDLPSALWSGARAVKFGAPRMAPAKRFAAWAQDIIDRLWFISAQDQITVLDHFNHRLLKRYFGRDGIVVRSGLDLERFMFRPREAITGNAVKILATGIFLPHRRFEDVIEASVLLREWGFDPALTVIGDTSSAPAYAERLRHMVEDRRVGDCVSFRGAVSDDALARAYAEHDVFVFPNEEQTWGLAVFEAMASGLPVVVSRGAGAHEVLTDLKDCILVNPRDPMNIARAVRECVRNPKLYAALSRNGSAFVRKYMSWKHYADGMLAVFRGEPPPAP